MKPRCRSEWITPAHSGAAAPARNVHARDSLSPVVRNVALPSIDSADRARRGTTRLDHAELGEQLGPLGALGGDHVGIALDLHAHRSASSPNGAAIASAASSWSMSMLTTTSAGLLVSRNTGASSARSSAVRSDR